VHPLQLALDIANGMQYIHSQGVLHQDLKPVNIVIDAKYVPTHPCIAIVLFCNCQTSL
jgi:serine/threonine protein kinase